MHEAADRIIELYRRHDAQWVLARGAVLQESAWIDRFRLLLADGGHVLDLGCGSGVPIARYLMAGGCRVTGVDTSEGMVALFRRNLAGERAICADMRGLDLGERFDGVLAWDSFFHLDHDAQRAMFPVFRAHARPGAPVMFTSGAAHGEAIGTFAGEPLYHASLDPEEYRLLLDTHGFDAVSHVLDDPGCGGHSVWLARAR